MSLRAILGGSRVKKRAAPKKPASPKKAPVRPPKAVVADDDEDEDIGDTADFSDDDQLLDDNGLVASLADDLTLKDVVQALRYARGNMFEPVPNRQTTSTDDGKGTTSGGPRTSGGFVGNSTRVAELLNIRRRMPPLATTAHVAAILPNATLTERETVSLVQAGILLKVVQPQWRRGFSGKGQRGSETGNDPRANKALVIGGESLGEVLVETAEMQSLVRKAALSEDTKEAFSEWLGSVGTQTTPAATQPKPAKLFTVNGRPAPQLAIHMVDELVRAGFLVGHGASAGLVGSMSVGHRSGGGSESSTGGRRGDRRGETDTGDVYARPEDRTTLLSLETVARAASGSFDAVGGIGAVYTAGGGGARGARGTKSSSAPTPSEDLLLSIPGHGSFVKLVSGALAYLVGIIARTPHRETLETSLRERWDAGGSIAKRKEAGSTSFGGHAFKRVPLSKTKKWKDFHGLSFDWVLAEAVGAGLIELFDTGSVGRGVRLLS